MAVDLSIDTTGPEKIAMPYHPHDDQSPEMLAWYATRDAEWAAKYPNLPKVGLCPEVPRPTMRLVVPRTEREKRDFFIRLGMRMAGAEVDLTRSPAA